MAALEGVPFISACHGLLPDTAIAYDDFSLNSKNIGFHLLSHFHADHYQGLHGRWKGSKIYCSTVTKRLIIQKWNIDAEMIIGLKLNTIYSIPYFDGCKKECTIELFDANHCPGAVMFLLTGYFGSYFLSGDIRYCNSMGEKLKQRGFPELSVDCLLLDCTFSDPFFNFPTQQQAVKQILQLIENGIGAEKREIYLEAEMLGLEQILIAIAKKYKTKIHVAEKKNNQMRIMPSLAKYFTTNGDETRFHVCPFKTFKSLEIESASGHVPSIYRSRKDSTTPTLEKMDGKERMFIKPSTMWFCANRTQNPNLLSFHTNPVLAKDAWHVLYSIHSSYSELQEFVKIIKPKKIIPWTDCSVSFIEKTNPFLDTTEPHIIDIPVEMQREFPYLKKFGNTIAPIAIDIDGNDENGKQSVHLCEDGAIQTHLTCWSPSPPNSPLPIPNTSVDDNDCVIIDENQAILQASPTKNKKETKSETNPTLSPIRIGW